MYSTIYLHLEAGTEISLGTASPHQIGITFDGHGPCIIGLSPAALDRLGALCIAGATALREARLALPACDEHADCVTDAAS